MKEIAKSLGAQAFQSIRKDLLGISLLVGAMWLVFFLGMFVDLGWLALLPRQLIGLPGIIAMPFLHADLEHLLGNTFPLIVLLALLAGSRAHTWKLVFAIILGSGLLLWVAGLAAPGYVGASMLIFGLIGFLVPAGIFERRPVPMLISIVVGVMYGGMFLTGLLPISSRTSELAHFYGALTGFALAFLVTRPELAPQVKSQPQANIE